MSQSVLICHDVSSDVDSVILLIKHENYQIFSNKINDWLEGRHGGAVFCAASSQQEGHGSDFSAPDPFCVEFACYLCVSVGSLSGFSGFFPQSKNRHVSLIGDRH